MAQNITLLGASYSDVPAVLLPKTGGGTARFDDTTITANAATAADIASGKQAVVNGALLTGTASGGGGGASNVVIGSFTTGSSGTTGSIDVPYTGVGFPLACMVYIKGGAYNPANTEWYNAIHRYAVGQWTYHNATQSSSDNRGVTTWVFKNNGSAANSYGRNSAMNTTVRTSTAPVSGGATCVNMTTDGKTLRWYVSTTSYGLLADMEYTYIMIFSE